MLLFFAGKIIRYNRLLRSKFSIVLYVTEGTKDEMRIYLRYFGRRKFMRKEILLRCIEGNIPHSAYRSRYLYLLRIT